MNMCFHRGGFSSQINIIYASKNKSFWLYAVVSRRYQSKHCNARWNCRLMCINTELVAFIFEVKSYRCTHGVRRVIFFCTFEHIIYSYVHTKKWQILFTLYALKWMCIPPPRKCPTPTHMYKKIYITLGARVVYTYLFRFEYSNRHI